MEDRQEQFEGMWDDQTINAIKKELQETQSDYLQRYEIRGYTPPKYVKKFIFFKQLQAPAKLNLVTHYDTRLISLKDFIEANRERLKHDIDLQQKIMGAVYSAFDVVMKSIIQLKYHIKLISLHPSNILISVEQRGNSIKINRVVFTKYLPEIFYENIITKKNLAGNGYPNVMSEDMLYISPRYLNYNPNVEFNGKKGVFTGSENIDFKDSYYSLGCLFANIALGYDLVKRTGSNEILSLYASGKSIKISEFDLQVSIRSVVEILMSLKATDGEVRELPYIKSLENSQEHEQEPISLKDLQFISNIGSGATGTLFKCLYTNRNGKKEIVAAKEMKLKDQGITTNQIFIEYEMLSMCKDDNFIGVKGLVYTTESINPTNKSKGDYYYILMELANQGSLDSYVAKKYQHGVIPKEFIEHVFIEMYCGLWFLHSRCIVHRDIKPLNVLVVTNKQNPEYPHIKICDLGQAKIVMSEDEAPKTFAGTTPYMSPEFQNPGNPYTYTIDLWSFAVTIYELITYRLALGLRGSKNTINRIGKVDVLFNEGVWDELPEMKEVLQHLFVYDYEDRWGWPQLFRNNYIQSLLFKRQKRMMEEQNPGKTIQDADVRVVLERENEERTELYKKLFKFAYIQN